MAMIFVTHDLGVAAQIADKVAVMYAGRFVEFGDARDVLMNPQHPYTRAMLSSTVKDQHRGAPLEAIAGTPPDLRALPTGCGFAPRCKFAVDHCRAAMPDAVVDSHGHSARCFGVSARAGMLHFEAPQPVAEPALA